MAVNAGLYTFTADHQSLIFKFIIMRMQPTICKISFLLLFVAGVFSSCHTGTTVSIPNPEDTSALGKINHFIPVEDIERFKKDFAVQRDSLGMIKNGLFIPISEAFNKKILLEILKDEKCVGMRMYYGVKRGDNESRNEIRLILVGVDAQGKDLYITEGGLLSKAATQAGGRSGGGEWGQCTPPCSGN
jgi:hypothetical protein